jgi:hypothetical protein
VAYVQSQLPREVYKGQGQALSREYLCGVDVWPPAKHVPDAGLLLSLSLFYARHDTPFATASR